MPEDTPAPMPLFTRDELKQFRYKCSHKLAISMTVGAIYLLPTSASNVKTEEFTKVMAHTMKKGETAYDVFSSYGIDYYENLGKLKSYNHGNDLTKIAAGEKLLIPII